MTKKKQTPKSQYRQYQTQSRTERKEQARQPNRSGLIWVGIVVVIVVVLAIIFLINRNSQEPATSVEPRALTDLDPIERNNFYAAPPEMTIDTSHDYQAVIDTEYGSITIDLFEQDSPITVNNFVFLARQGFYDGTSFHRVIEGFMAQGGDPSGSGAGGPGYSFVDETENGLAFDRPGLLAMANSGPNTNGSQFFITFNAQGSSHLTGLHTIFGEVTDGMDVTNLLTRGDPGSVPGFAGDTILRISILEDGEES